MPRRAASPASGHAARVERSRRALCEAFLDLVREGNLRPGADEIAARAGLSRRSLFHHFTDLAELYDAAYEVGMRLAAPLMKEIPRNAPVGERLAMLVDSRCRFLEATSPFSWEVTARAVVGPAREQARKSSAASLDRQCLEIRNLFAKELAPLSGRERNETVQAMAAGISPLAWGHLRNGRGLSYAAARAVVTRTLRALLRDVGASLDAAQSRRRPVRRAATRR